MSLHVCLDEGVYPGRGVEGYEHAANLAKKELEGCIKSLWTLGNLKVEKGWGTTEVQRTEVRLWRYNPPLSYNKAFQIHPFAICIKPRRLSFDLTQKPDPAVSHFKWFIVSEVTKHVWSKNHHCLKKIHECKLRPWRWHLCFKWPLHDKSVQAMSTISPSWSAC